MVNFGYPYNDIVICKDSTDYLKVGSNFKLNCELQTQFSQSYPYFF